MAGFFLLGVLINSILAVVGLYVLELVGLWPPDEPSSDVRRLVAANPFPR